MFKLKVYFLNKEYHNFLKSNIKEFLFKDIPYIFEMINQILIEQIINIHFISYENNKKLAILRIDKMIYVLENNSFIKEISINESHFIN